MHGICLACAIERAPYAEAEEARAPCLYSSRGPATKPGIPLDPQQHQRRPPQPIQSQPQQLRPLANGSTHYQPRAQLSSAVPTQHQQLRSATLRPPQQQQPQLSQPQRPPGMLPRRAAQQGQLRSGAMLQGGPHATTTPPAVPALAIRPVPASRSHFGKVQTSALSLPLPIPSLSDLMGSGRILGHIRIYSVALPRSTVKYTMQFLLALLGLHAAD